MIEFIIYKITCKISNKTFFVVAILYSYDANIQSENFKNMNNRHERETRRDIHISVI